MFGNRKLISSRSLAALMGFLFIVLSPLLLLNAIELTLSFFHNHISSDYFDNEREMLARNAILPVKFLLDPEKFADDLRGSKTKIAVFGESSAAGYASPIGFAELLEKALPEQVVVHNFAEPGAPFAGTQADLANLLVSYYNVIIIYAGHNEIWSYLNGKNRTQGEIISLPWGGRIDHTPGDLRHSLKLVSLQKFLANNSFNATLPLGEKITTEILGRAYDISLNSRLVFLIKSFSKKVARLQDSLESKAPEAVQRLPFFISEPFLDQKAKREMTSGYSRSVLEIIDKLRPDQTLILSTIVANDLFPPLLDVASRGEIADAERKVNNFYETVAHGKADFAGDDVAKLPGVAHKAYLQSALCMNGITPTEEISLRKDCLDFALLARERDTFSNRADPSLNNFIRSMKNQKPNVRVIDPEAVIREARTQREYFDYFVDFHHPSARGHLLIANLMIPELPVTPRVVITQKTDDCDTFIATSEKGEREIVPEPVVFEMQLRNNIAWHENFIKKVSTPWLYALYKERAEAKLRKCFSR
jgi:hypothetical protein